MYSYEDSAPHRTSAVHCLPQSHGSTLLSGRMLLGPTEWDSASLSSPPFAFET